MKDAIHRGQVDLIALQSTPDGEFKWLMDYQDHLTIRKIKTCRKIGLSSSSLPSEVIPEITSEERQSINEERTETDFYYSCAADTNGEENIQVFEMSDIPIVQNTETESNIIIDEIETNRTESAAGQKRAAEKMLQTSQNKFKLLSIGRNVVVEVLKVDRSLLYAKNIVGTILQISN
ncbi:vesicular acetylcholine transporter [Holotrichia oblita]|uniref:Vesicular acetylcholine transporter n=1 Tax=Holotrichia oblita TaxID=644536 RepID=A0ACB9SZD5_HOLOL|nr:vesicular acetylcholine transporter [Holotrichia oblita]